MTNKDYKSLAPELFACLLSGQAVHKEALYPPDFPFVSDRLFVNTKGRDCKSRPANVCHDFSYKGCSSCPGSKIQFDIKFV